MARTPDDNPNPAQSEQDLDWQAFLYVSREMGPAESAAFERRLEQDQLACEVVAHAVEMVGAVTASIEITQPPAAFQTARRPWMRIAAAAAVALLCLALFQSLRRNQPALSPAFVSRQIPPGMHEAGLIALWTESQEQAEDSPEPEPDNESSDFTVPDWLLAAVESAEDKKVEEN